MPRIKSPDTTAATARPPFAPQKAGERGSRNTGLTSERIAEDLAAFRRAGGRIEVLGVTRTLTRIEGEAPPAAAAPTPAGKRRR
jgi:hypothetical protein